MVTIDLSGPDGNAYALMAMAETWSKQLGLDSKPIIDDMESGDYEHLLEVMEKHFGNFILFLKHPSKSRSLNS